MSINFYKKGDLVYQFINSPKDMARIKRSYDIRAEIPYNGSAQIIGNALLPAIIHIYDSDVPNVSDPFRSFQFDIETLSYKEI